MIPDDRRVPVLVHHHPKKRSKEQLISAPINQHHVLQHAHDSRRCSVSLFFLLLSRFPSRHLRVIPWLCRKGGKNPDASDTAPTSVDKGKGKRTATDAELEEAATAKKEREAQENDEEEEDSDDDDDEEDGDEEEEDEVRVCEGPYTLYELSLTTRCRKKKMTSRRSTRARSVRVEHAA